MGVDENSVMEGIQMVSGDFMKRFGFIILASLIGVIPTASFGSWADSMSPLPQKAQGAWDVYKRYKAGTASKEEILQVKKVKKIVYAVAAIIVGAGIGYCLYRKGQKPFANKNDWSQLFEQVQGNIRIHRATQQGTGCCGPSSLINIVRMLDGRPVMQPYGNKIRDIYESCEAEEGTWLYHEEMQNVVEKDEQFRRLGIRIFGGWNQDKFMTPKEVSEIGEWVVLKLFDENRPAGLAVHIDGNHWVGVVVRINLAGEVKYEIADSMNSTKAGRLPESIEQVVKLVSVAKAEYER